MSGELEAAADIATGAVVAHAVEGDAGGESGGAGATICLNCSAILSGAYCSSCGQKREIHRTLTSFWHDFTHSILHFEGKIWRTLPLLFFKPGDLTRRYVHGERARFVSPLATFLFSIFLLFAAINYLGGPFSPTSSTDINGQRVTRVEIAAGLAKARDALARAKANKASPGELAKFQEDVSELELGLAFSDGFDPEDFKTGPNDFDISNAALKAKLRHAFENPQLLFYKMQSSAYKFSWALIPISVPLVWLLFPFRREYRMFDHAVFVTYSLSFMSMLFALASLLKWLGPLEVTRAPALSLVPLLHMFLQLRGAYQLANWGALWRTALLALFAIFALTLFGFLILALGVSG